MRQLSHIAYIVTLNFNMDMYVYVSGGKKC